MKAKLQQLQDSAAKVRQLMEQNQLWGSTYELIVIEYGSGYQLKLLKNGKDDLVLVTGGSFQVSFYLSVMYTTVEVIAKMAKP